MWTSSKVRKTFIDFFCKKKEHTFIPSSSVVPVADETLLFTNAGMNQFKPIFLGQAKEESMMGKLVRATNSQKCIRAGGKHNDLEDVGKDVYHHTFFEMLGNWSFGNYFKKEAIDWAWEILTEVYGLEKDRIYASYFGGDEKEGLPEDIEARDLWKQYLPPERILPFGKKENFWEMGETGPCGGCSEIHYDRIGNRDASSLVNEDDPNVLEIWNLVFIEYNRHPNGKLEKLPSQHVDTGMGFERLTSILQNKTSNYDTDCFTPIFKEIQEKSKCRPYTGLLGEEDEDGIDMAYRVVADHIRTLTVAITDGGKIGNKGRNYVLKRIARRASRFRREVFKTEPGFLSSLVDIVVTTLGPFYPELTKSTERVKKMILKEEKVFAKTLDKGIKMFKDVSKKYGEQKKIPGDVAFLLYQSFGFPLDMTIQMAEEIKFTVDVEGYDKSQECHVKRSQQKSKEKMKSLKIEKPVVKLDVFLTTKLQKELKIQTTNDDDKFNWESENNTKGKILSLISCPQKKKKEEEEEEEDGEEEEEETYELIQNFSLEDDNEFCGIILDCSSFYYEQGGQVNDTGLIFSLKKGDMEFEVLNVQSFAGYVVHTGRLKKGDLKIGQEVEMIPNLERRKEIAKNHTCTHLLNFSLRKCFGGGGEENVEQQGSHVDENRLRFDFNWGKKSLNLKGLSQLQKTVNELITRKLDVFDRSLTYEKAKDIYGLRCMFKDTYPEIVRVVSIGSKIDEMEKDPKNEKWFESSVELCGGTHIKNSEEISGFIITKEGSSSAGVRRIFGVTGSRFIESQEKGKYFVDELEKLKNLKKSDESLFSKKRKLLGEEIGSYPYLSIILKKQLDDELKKLFKDRKKKGSKEKEKETDLKFNEMLKKCEDEVINNGKKYLTVVFEGIEVKEMKRMMSFTSRLEKKLKDKSVPVMILSVNEVSKNVCFLVTVPKKMTKIVSSKDCFECFKEFILARGGGSPMKCQGTGKKIEGVSEAIKKGSEYFSSKL